MNQKFTCADCGKSYPFESQLKDHHMKHRTKKRFQCMATKGGKWFKIESSLTKHMKMHDGIMHKCHVVKDCDYQNVDKRNVHAHEKTHSDKNDYGCDRCGKAFKYWMQMD